MPYSKQCLWLMLSCYILPIVARYSFGLCFLLIVTFPRASLFYLLMLNSPCFMTTQVHLVALRPEVNHIESIHYLDEHPTSLIDLVLDFYKNGAH